MPLPIRCFSSNQKLFAYVFTNKVFANDSDIWQSTFYLIYLRLIKQLLTTVQ